MMRTPRGGLAIPAVADARMASSYSGSSHDCRSDAAYSLKSETLRSRRPCLRNSTTFAYRTGRGRYQASLGEGGAQYLRNGSKGCGKAALRIEMSEVLPEE